MNVWRSLYDSMVPCIRRRPGGWWLAALVVVFGGLIQPVRGFSQADCTNSKVWIDTTLLQVRQREDMPPSEKVLRCERARQLAVMCKDPCRRALACITQSVPLDILGQIDSALVRLLEASRLLSAYSCDSLLHIRLYVNLSGVYLSAGDLHLVDSLTDLALSAWNPSWTEVQVRFAAMNNAAIAHAKRGRFAEASMLLRQLYKEARQARDTSWIQQSLNNICPVVAELGQPDSARYYNILVGEIAVASRNYADYLTMMVNMAILDQDDGRFEVAADTLTAAYALASRLSRKENMADIQRVRAYLFDAMGRSDLAFAYLDSFVTLNGEILDEQRLRAMAEMNERFESERKARQIQRLELEKLDATVERQKANSTRNASILAAIMIMGLAGGLWSRLRYVRRSRAAIQQQMAVADGLLLNILPASVASELKSSGSARARQYSQATILFSDFQDFTFISSHMDPERLVSEVNTYFKAFDAITRHYGLEKIKTIGDAYMAAAGLDEISRATAVDAVRAALAMQAYVARRAQEICRQGLPVFEMRMGLHSGPVIAGVVGDSKFQYDLWGDTVNTASRMEGLGETGRVNISESTYQLVRHEPAFSFQARGLLEVKGKGQMPLYFVMPAVPDEGMERLVDQWVSDRLDRQKS